MEQENQVNILQERNKYTQTSVDTTSGIKGAGNNEKATKDSYTQTDNSDKNKENETLNSESNGVSSAWDIQSDGDKTKSIADQVKEVAQNALQQTGMVYVETAGMYYDYKTGYYYNSVSIFPLINLFFNCNHCSVL